MSTAAPADQQLLADAWVINVVQGTCLFCKCMCPHSLKLCSSQQSLSPAVKHMQPDLPLNRCMLGCVLADLLCAGAR